MVLAFQLSWVLPKSKKNGEFIGYIKYLLMPYCVYFYAIYEYWNLPTLLNLPWDICALVKFRLRNKKWTGGTLPPSNESQCAMENGPFSAMIYFWSLKWMSSNWIKYPCDVSSGFIKRGNWKSIRTGGFNRKITYKTGVSSIAMFDFRRVHGGSAAGISSPKIWENLGVFRWISISHVVGIDVSGAAKLTPSLVMTFTVCY